jgi:hypothetical protein
MHREHQSQLEAQGIPVPKDAHQVSAQFRILEGYGDPTNPEKCWDIEWVANPDGSDMVFTSMDEAVEYSQNYYDVDLFERQMWKSFWTYVTDADTIGEAMNEWDMKS